MNDCLTLDEISNWIDGDYLRQLGPREFGKAMAHPAERYVSKRIREDLDIACNRADDSKPYDIIAQARANRIQVKFRQVNGVTPFSRQVYTHNWRQRLHLAGGYRIQDFDMIVLVLCHKGKKEPKDWLLCCLPSALVEDPNAKGFVYQDIPPHILQQGKDWQSQFLAV